jgi:hypothetical protein
VDLEAEQEDDHAASSSQPLLSSRPRPSRSREDRGRGRGRGRVTRQVELGGTLTIESDGSYAYAYGPKGLAGLRHNYYALLCAFFASIGGLEFGYDQGVVSVCAVLASASSVANLRYISYLCAYRVCVVDCECTRDGGLYETVAYYTVAEGDHE